MSEDAIGKERTDAANKGVHRATDPGDAKSPGPGAERERLTEEERRQAAESDPDSRPLSEEQLRRGRRLPDVKGIRDRLGMSQREFASAFGLGLRTVQEWEQRRFVPNRAARILLHVIDANPAAVLEALGHPASEVTTMSGDLRSK